MTNLCLLKKILQNSCTIIKTAVKLTHGNIAVSMSKKENVMETLNQQVVKELEQMKLLGFKISKKTILLAAREDLTNMSMSVGEIADYLIEVTSYN